MTQKLELLYQLTFGSYHTTPLIEAIQDRGVAIGASATNKLRLMQNLREPKKGFVIGIRTKDSAEKLWSITPAGREYLKEQLEPKAVYKFDSEGQGIFIERFS